MKARAIIFCYALFSLAGCGGAVDKGNNPPSGASSSSSSSSISSSSSSSSGTPLPPEFDLSEAQIQESIFCPAGDNERGLTEWPAARSDDELEGILNGQQGVRVHGAIPSGNIYVFGEGGFYYSAYTRNPALAETFKTLKRNDGLTITANYTRTGSAQPHINVSELTRNFESDSTFKHQFDYSRFDGLESVTLLGSVHAVAGDGEVLVFNYEDIVIPVFVDEALHEEVSALWKFDKVLLDLSIQRIPGRPLHFYTRDDSDDAIRLVDAITDCDGVTTDLIGNIWSLGAESYGIEVFDENKVYRSYLVTTGDSLVEEIWNQNLDKVEDGKGDRKVISGFKVKMNTELWILPGAAHLFTRKVNSIEILND